MSDVGKDLDGLKADVATNKSADTNILGTPPSKTLGQILEVLMKPLGLETFLMDTVENMSRLQVLVMKPLHDSRLLEQTEKATILRM